MNNMIKIRMAKKNDIEQILYIAKQVYEMVQQHRLKCFGTVMEFHSTFNFYFNAMKSESSVIFVAEKEKGGVVGYVYATIERQQDDLINIPYVSVNEIAAKTEHRSFGIGKSLMESVQRWAREKGLTVIQLATWEFNKEALGFFKKLGYNTIMRKMEKVLE